MGGGTTLCCDTWLVSQCTHSVELWSPLHGSYYVVGCDTLSVLCVCVCVMTSYMYSNLLWARWGHCHHHVNHGRTHRILRCLCLPRVPPNTRLCMSIHFRKKRHGEVMGRQGGGKVQPRRRVESGDDWNLHGHWCLGYQPRYGSETK